MESKKLDRNYLETLSSAELISIADEYGVDIPDDLNRRLIIGDLLELAEEMNSSAEKTETISVLENIPDDLISSLPESYNETKINVIIRNPVSLYVYWDFSESTLKQLVRNHTDVKLHLCFFDDADMEKPVESFDVQLEIADRSQYVLIPGGSKYVRVDLIQDSAKNDSVLAVSSRLHIPQGNNILSSFRPGKEMNIPEALKNSGIEELLNSHYNNYRQSFY